jgi:nitroreductase
MNTGLESVATADGAALDCLLQARHSCRGFLPTPVPRTLQRKILAMAQRTASWCNSQPWQVHITEGAATERFRAALLTPKAADEAGPDFAWPTEYRGVYRQRRLDCALQLYESVGIARGDREASAKQAQENFRLFGAPHVAIVTTDAALGVYGAVDCGGFVANFLLAARSLGVATIAQAALASRPARVREFFGLGEDRLVVCGVSFGYADEGHAANGFRTTRAAPDDAANWLTT